MTFYINYTNGANLTAISDGTINTTSTSLTLIGKNFPTYGQLINQNLVSMLENWANSTSPNFPLIGQIWYDSNKNVIKYYRGGSSNNYWQDVANILYSSSIPSSPQQNDFWWDSTNQQLKYYDQLNWITIGPQTTNDGLNRVSGTNSFIVQIGGNNVFTVDAYGRVNAAYNPVVQAYGYYSGSPFTSLGGLGTPTPYIPASVPINIGGYFNAATGYFTCPVAGIYQVTGTAVSLGYNSIPAPYQRIEWYKNGSTTNISCQAQNPASITSESFDTPMIATGYVQCNAGDSLLLQWAVSANGQIDNNNSTLSIRLVA
jgi:C1q domain